VSTVKYKRYAVALDDEHCREFALKSEATTFARSKLPVVWLVLDKRTGYLVPVE
jgi:hypothetical protein